MRDSLRRGGHDVCHHRVEIPESEVPDYNNDFATDELGRQ